MDSFLYSSPQTPPFYVGSNASVAKGESAITFFIPSCHHQVNMETAPTSLVPDMVVGRVAEMNAHGIVQYLQGQHHAALNTLKKALALLKGRMDNPQPSVTTSQRQRFKCRAVIGIDPSQECPYMHSCGSLFPFYTSPFHLLPAQDDDLPEDNDDDDVKNDRILPFVVVMYNLALVYHTIALKYRHHTNWSRRRRDAPVYFQRALQLYEYSLHLHREQHVSLLASSSMDYFSSEQQLCLLLATCNNMAFVYSQDCNVCAINHCLLLMHDLMLFCDEEAAQPPQHLLHRDGSDPELFSMTGKAYNFFFFTSMMLEGRLMNLAPAA